MSLEYEPEWNNETQEYCDVPNLFIKFSKKNNSYMCPCGMSKRYFETSSQYKTHIAKSQHKEFLHKKTIDKLRNKGIKERNMRIEERNKRKDAECKLEKEICKAKTIHTKNLEFDRKNNELLGNYLGDVEEYERRYQAQCEEARNECDFKKEERTKKYQEELMSSKRKRDESISA